MKVKSREQISRLGGVIASNESSHQRTQWWLSLEGTLDRDEWLTRGLFLQAISQAPLDEALRIFEPCISSNLDWVRCVEAGRWDVALHDVNRLMNFIRVIGEGHMPLGFSVVNPDTAGRLALLRGIVGTERFFRARQLGRLGPAHITESSAPLSVGGVPEMVAAMDELVEIAAATSSSGDDKDLLEAMATVVSAMSAIFGDAWVTRRISLIAATVPSRFGKLKIAEDHSPGDAYIAWARRARLSRSDSSFWHEAISDMQRTRGLSLATCAALFTWADPEILVSLLPEVADSWAHFTAWEVADINRMVQKLIPVSGVGRNAPRRIAVPMTQGCDLLPSSVLGTLLLRTNPKASKMIIQHILAKVRDDPSILVGAHGPVVASLLIDATSLDWPDRKTWRTKLDEVRRLNQAATGTVWPRIPEVSAMWLTGRAIHAVAREVLAAPMDYPIELLRHCNTNVEMSMTIERKPLRDIAISENWFPGLPV